MAKISELEESKTLVGLYTLGVVPVTDSSGKTREESRKVSLEFIKDKTDDATAQAAYAKEQGDYAKEIGNGLNARVTAVEEKNAEQDQKLTELGSYVDVSEWIKVTIDNQNKILYGVRADGKFYFGDGCPPQVQAYVTELLGKYSASDYDDVMIFLGNLINGDNLESLLIRKVDKIDGKSLVDEGFAESVYSSKNTEWVKVDIDNNNRLLEGTTNKGTKVFGGDVEVLGNATVNGIPHKLVESNDWCMALLDNDNKILYGIDKEGKLHADIYGIDKKIADEVTEGIQQLYDSLIESIKEKYESVHEQMCWQNNNVIQGIDIDTYRNKTMTVIPPDKYSCWPRIGKVGDTLVCAYVKSLDHNDPHNGNGAIWVTTSKNGVVWSPKKLIIDTENIRDGVTGGGNDEDGNYLLINRVGYPSNPATYYEFYKTIDGINFNKISTIPSSEPLGHCGDIINIPTRGLMAFFGTYGDTRSWGYILSTDNGNTWTKTVIDTVAKNECPMEMSAAYLGNGKILVVGRYEGTGTSNMWQIQSSDYGVTWTKEATNITGRDNTPSILYNSETDVIDLYIYNRATGKLEHRTSLAVDIWDNPTAWPDHSVVASGNIGYDSGNVTTVQFGDLQLATYYDGNPTDSGIYTVIV